MYKIYVAAIEPLMEDAFYLKAFSMVGIERQKKTEKMIRRTDKARSVAAGLLLRYAVARNAACFDRSRDHRLTQSDRQAAESHTDVLDSCLWDGSCVVGEHGKPMLPEKIGLYFNLSHSGDYAACAVSDQEIGADIQKHKRYEEKLAERFFHPEELAYLEAAEDRKRSFFDLWCLKESCIKCTGRGLGTGLERFSVVPLFYGEEITLDGIRCTGECDPVYIRTDLTDFSEIRTKEPIGGYSMAVTLAVAAAK